MIRLQGTGNLEKCDEDELNFDFPNDLFASLNKNKLNLRLDLDFDQKFERKCPFTNDLLIKAGYFSRIYEFERNFDISFTKIQRKKTFKEKFQAV